MATSAAHIDYDEGSAPATPGTGKVRLYAKTDGLLYSKDDTGAEAALAGSAVIGSTSTYTPSWTSSGTAPSIGNGTLSGRYVLIGSQLLWLAIHFVYGSTSSAGTGNYSLSLPSAYKTLSTGKPQTAAARFLDSGTAHYAASATIDENDTTLSVVVADSSGVRLWAAGVPVTLATGDQLEITGLIEVEAV